MDWMTVRKALLEILILVVFQTLGEVPQSGKSSVVFHCLALVG
jgi:hypothetical protein